MAIIAISRGTFSGAREIAEYISQALGYKLVTREDITATLTEYGVSEDRLHRARYKQLGIRAKLDLEWTHYLVCARAALSRQIHQGNLVYLGNDAGILLRDFPTVLRLYVIAHMENRIDVFMKRNNFPLNREEAKRFIKRVDAKRSRWGKILYNDGHFQPTDFDLVIDPGDMSIADAFDLVWTTMDSPDFLPTPASLNTIECMTIAMELRAKIAMEADIVDDQIDVEVRDGEIKIAGSVHSPEDIENIKSLLDTHPEFKAVELTSLEAAPSHRHT